MNDRPTAGELVDAVRLFLEKELLPGLTDARLRFQTLVAANVLSIACREMHSEEALLREEWQILAPLLGEKGEEPVRIAALRQAVKEMNERLCTLICQGAYDAPEQWHGLARVQRHLVLRKLEVASPRHIKARSASEGTSNR
jgi:hypothetical protein